jgi:phosphatidylglycerophosphate synthase
MDIDEFLDRENKYFRKLREKILRPFLKLLYKDHITANYITNLRLMLAILFFLIFNEYRTISLIIITFAILLDLLDGPIARYEHFSSDRGKFLDIVVDSISYLMIISTFVYFNINFILIALHIVSINYAYLFAIIKKNELKKSDWIIHPTANSTYLKLLPVSAFYIFHLFNIDYLELSLYIATSLCILAFTYYYITIQIRWRKLYGKHF